MLDQILKWIPELVIILVTGGFVTVLVSRFFERTDEKRKLYASAFKTALSWQEMVHRVRRRGKKEEEKRNLINTFHSLQEDLNYYQGIISTESVSLGRSYSRFVEAIKTKNAPLIKKAWEDPRVELADDLLVTGNAGKEADEFLSDVRHWLKWCQLPKLRVIWRNKKCRNS